MPIVLSAAAMVPAAGEIGAAGAAFGPIGLAVAAAAIVGYIAYEAGFFDWLGEVLVDGWNWLKNGFGKVVQKAKSVVQDDIIPGVLAGYVRRLEQRERVRLERKRAKLVKLISMYLRLEIGGLWGRKKDNG